MTRGRTADAIPRTRKDAIDRARWKDMQVACKHAPDLFTVEGRQGLMCNRCKLVLVW